MFRPLTLLSLVAAAGAGYYLYQVKQSVAQLDRELRDVRRQTETAMERTQVLRAEWAMLNEPDRLRQVVQRTLTLEPMTPGQFVRFSDLSRRTGAPQVFAGAPSLFAAPRAAEPDAVAVAAAPAAAAP
ncbi:cell division protein FtsL, partial [Plastoroseomonas hellenica]|nr:ABC transporter permease [Plastoroseomonas hellenica]